MNNFEQYVNEVVSEYKSKVMLDVAKGILNEYEDKLKCIGIRSVIKRNICQNCNCRMGITNKNYYKCNTCGHIEFK